MTINEFRAWLDGFKEAIDKAPTPEQWEKVLEKAGTVREASVLPYVPTTYPSTLPGTVPYLGTPRFGEITCRTGLGFLSASSTAAN